MTATMKVQLSYLKHQSKPEKFLVSDVDDPTDYHTRRVALAETVVDGKELAVASVHLSWWDKGFQEEWARFETVLKTLNKPLLLAGDFNNPSRVRKDIKLFQLVHQAYKMHLKLLKRKVVAIPFHQKLMDGREIQNHSAQTMCLRLKNQKQKIYMSFLTVIIVLK